MDAVDTPLAPGHKLSGRALVALVTVWVVWGSTYLGIRFVVETMPPLLAGGLRFVCAGTLLLALAWATGRLAWRSITRRHLVSALLVGTALLAAGNGLVSWVQSTGIASGVAALLVSMTPLWIALTDRVRYRQRLHPRAIVGLLTGFGGLVLLVRPWSADRLDPVGVLLLVVASIAWTFGTVYARTAPIPSDPIVWTGLQTLAGGLVGLLTGTLAGEWSQFAPGGPSTASLVAFGYLVLFGSVVAFTAYAWLIRNVPLSVASTYAYVNPVVAVALGALLAGEPVTGPMLGGGAIIVASVVLIVTAPRVGP